MNTAYDNGGGAMQVGSVNVETTDYRGFSIEEWTERILAKIVHVAEESNPIIHQQAIEYKDAIRQVLIVYLRLAIKSDRTTLYNLFTQQGHKDMADILRRL